MNTDKILFEYHGVTASESLEKFAAEKLDSLFTKFEFIIRADVFFKTENTSSNETGMKCGIRLSAPGPRLFAETSHTTFHMAVADTVDELNKQLRKRKEQMKTH